MPKPVSIYRSLVGSLLLVIVLLSSAILATTVFGIRRAVRTLSGSLISRTIDQSELELRRFLGPVTRGLEVAQSWGKAGMLNHDDTDRLARFFVPMMLQFPQVSSLLVADSTGREFMLLRTADKWRVRLANPNQWGGRTRWFEWTEQAGEVNEYWKDLDYDPRNRPWYQGAIKHRDKIAAEPPDSQRRFERAVHWTSPYTFFTTNAPGITASVTYDAGDGLDHVIGFDVLLEDVSKFTTNLTVSQRGMVAVLTEDDRFVGLPRMEAFTSEAGRKAALLKRPDELDIPLMRDAAKAFSKHLHGPDQQEVEPFEFTSAGQPWWGAAKEFPLSADRTLIIAVVVPTADILGTLPQLRVWIILITVCVLTIAVLQATALARRYSRPIQDMVEESDRISRLDLEKRHTTLSPIAEVRRLAEAHERMRASLQSLLKLERDLQVARQIQQKTFPQRLPALDGFDVAGHTQPADETGGDSYDVIGYTQAPDGTADLTENRADFAVLMIADATGHGVGPALSGSQARAMLRMAVRMGQPLVKIITHMNEQIYADMHAGRFVTAWLGLINAADHTLTSFSAGQAPILRYDAKRDAFENHAADAPPLGVLPEINADVCKLMAMREGDIFAVLSDGIYEAVDRQGNQFGVDRVIEVVKAHRQKSADHILKAVWHAVANFTDGRPPTDDRTGIIIKRA